MTEKSLRSRLHDKFIFYESIITQDTNEINTDFETITLQNYIRRICFLEL